MTLLRVLPSEPAGQKPMAATFESIVDFVRAQMRPLRHATASDADVLLLRYRYERAETVFRDVRRVSTDRVPFPPIARIILNIRSRYNCGIQNMCHREGLPDDVANGDLSLPDLRRLAYVREAFGLEVAKLIGVETTPLPVFCEFVCEVKKLGFRSITTTCAIGVARCSIASAVAAGVDRITCSVHGFTGDVRITLDELVTEAGQRNVPVKLNWVLIQHNVAELPALLQYIGHRKLTARLFCLIRTSHAAGANHDEPLHWTDIADLFLPEIVAVRVVDYTLSCRRKYLATLRSGAILDLSVPLVAMHDLSACCGRTFVPCNLDGWRRFALSSIRGHRARLIVERTDANDLARFASLSPSPRIRRKLETLRRLPPALRIPFTTMPLASG